MLKKFIKLFTLFSFVLLSQSSFVIATIVLKMDVPELVKNSCSIVVGELVEIQKEWEDSEDSGRVVRTTLKVKVEKILKSCPAVHVGDVLPVIRMGGQIGDEGTIISGAPTFQLDTKILLFLVEMPNGEHIITGLSQGKFRILKDSITGEEVAAQDKNARTLLLVDPVSGKTTASSVPERIKLKDLLGEIDLRVLRHGQEEKGS